MGTFFSTKTRYQWYCYFPDFSLMTIVKHTRAAYMRADVSVSFSLKADRIMDLCDDGEM